ncbi:OmpA family protein [Aquifex aeolicus]|nr:OmpA family protein [Aquifex aeolicus]
MKKILIAGIAGSIVLAGCGVKTEDPCKDSKAAFSKYLIDKCYGDYMKQIEINKENIANLDKRVSALESDVDSLRREHEEIRAEIEKLKITGKEQVRVYFDSNKFTLRDDAKATLDELIDAVRDKDIKKVIVVGYADPRGTRGYNFELSMKRAQNVAAYLIKNGIPVEKVRIASYGEELANLIGERHPEQRAVDVIVLY